ncbi:hypothetical protein CJ030_MR7G017451 [Morella rubra]|uniref:RNase H type-1 domain-containing protein n=1 Tax=Morella rubra TaxID=262757 RepID=A0A6A1V571_9ROSI|nr:hypothetical protein CJ030_MR7G017451 [Morella rubra]
MDVMPLSHDKQSSGQQPIVNYARLTDLFIGGFGTTPETIVWTIAELINHPNAFNKLRQEIKSVVGSSRLVEESDVAGLPYLQAVVKEGLRLYPPLPVITRSARQDCKIEGFDIPKASMMSINLYAIMRDPDSWLNPNEFWPERFLVSTESEEETVGETLNLLTFGAGRRACPGAKLALTMLHRTVAAMVQCFDWKVGGDGEAKGDNASGSSFTIGSMPFAQNGESVQLTVDPCCEAWKGMRQNIWLLVVKSKTQGKLSWLPNGQNCRPEWREGITLNPAIRMMELLVFNTPAELISMILNADRDFNIEKGSLKAFGMNASIVLDCLWYSRNKLIHEAIPVDIRVLIEMIKRRYAEHANAWFEVGQVMRLRWKPPSSGWLIVNSDVAIRPNRSYIAISVRDFLSSLYMLYTERFAAMDPLVGKVVALVKAFSVARHCQWKPVEFECDSLVLCKEALSSVSPICWAIESLVVQIWSGLGEFKDWRIAWVPCSCNVLAHLLAKWATRTVCVGFLFLFLISSSIFGSFCVELKKIGYQKALKKLQLPKRCRHIEAKCRHMVDMVLTHSTEAKLSFRWCRHMGSKVSTHVKMVSTHGEGSIDTYNRHLEGGVE